MIFHAANRSNFIKGEDYDSQRKNSNIFLYRNGYFGFIDERLDLADEGIISNTAFAGNEDLIKQTEVAPQEFGNIPVYFEENKGQFDKRVKYFARGTSGYSLFLTATEAVYVLRQSRVQSPKSKVERLKNRNIGHKTQDSRAAAVFMKLVWCE